MPQLLDAGCVLAAGLEAIGQVGAIEQVSAALDVLPERAQEQLRGDSPGSRTQYALAVYLFAPLAIIVPLTISSAVGSATLVGERERGTGERTALAELADEFSMPTCAIVTIDEICEHLHGREIDGQIALDDESLQRIEAYRAEFGAAS